MNKYKVKGRIYKKLTMMEEEDLINKRAKHFYENAERIDEFVVLDSTAEDFLKRILMHYDGNIDNEVTFSFIELPKFVSNNLWVEFKKLYLYGMITWYNAYMDGKAEVNLSEQAKSYFKDKDAALQKKEEQNKHKESELLSPKLIEIIKNDLRHLKSIEPQSFKREDYIRLKTKYEEFFPGFENAVVVQHATYSNQPIIYDTEYLKICEILQAKLVKCELTNPQPQLNTTTGVNEGSNIPQNIDLKTAFLIMPFSESWSDTLFTLIKKIEDQTELKIKRADDIYGVKPIIVDVAKSIKEARVIIAIMTNGNRNVNYELGLAHAWNKPTIMIAEKIEDIPFDYQHLRVILYDTKNPSWGEKLIDDIVKTLENIEEENIMMCNYFETN